MQAGVPNVKPWGRLEPRARRRPGTASFFLLFAVPFGRQAGRYMAKERRLTKALKLGEIPARVPFPFRYNIGPAPKSLI